MRKLLFLFSAIAHIGLIYWLFTTQFPTAHLTVNEPITVVPIKAPTELLFYDPPKITKRAPKPTPKPTAETPSPSTPTKAPPTSPPAADRNKSDLKPPEFSLGAAKQPLFQHKPDFLLSRGKKTIIAAPDSKGIPKDGIDFRKFINTYSHLYPGSDFSRLIPLGQAGLTDFYKGPKGQIDFNVKGFNIRPWARKVTSKIQGNWTIQPQWLRSLNTPITVGVRIVIKKSGAISSAEIDQPSQVIRLDHSVLTAVNASSPFPSLPDEFPEKNLVAYLRFNINVDE
ncbi:MAG: TonB family protein [bacterium]|nr:TonB family protein [bacterium]